MSGNLTRLHQENPSIYRLSAKKVYNKFSSPAAFSAAACFSILLKEEGLQRKMYKAKLIHCSDLVQNLAVEIEIFNLFVCLFTCLFVPHVLPISQKENGPIIIPKTVLKLGL